MLVGCRLDYFYLSGEKCMAVDVFGVKFHDERRRKKSAETQT